MAALGLVAGQMALGTTVYSGVRDQLSITALNAAIEHDPSLSTLKPRKELGTKAPAVSGTIRVASAGLVAFVSAVTGTRTERKLSFVLGGSEVYVYVQAGSVTAITTLARGGVAAGYHDVGFVFRAHKTGVYLATTDAVLWGS